MSPLMKEVTLYKDSSFSDIIQIDKFPIFSGKKLELFSNKNFPFSQRESYNMSVVFINVFGKLNFTRTLNYDKT